MPYNTYWVYILASKRNGTLYIGVTNNIERRVLEHKNEINNSFTKKYNIKQLVYFEEFNDINDAILREKRFKKWKRKWKLYLIESNNPQWKDLSEGWYDNYL